ncbi:MAG: ATP-binding cassette domain-containing protein [Roseibacillus sp.]
MSTTNAVNSALVNLSKGLGIGYGSLLAEVTEDIPLENGTHYLLARNGRGKTTLLKTISGLIKKVAGEYETSGHCQFVGDDLSFDRELSARMVFNAIIPAERREDALELADALELEVTKEFGKLSFGNRKKIGLIVAEHRLWDDEPNIIFYDEPFTGLDTPAREIIRQRWDDTEQSVLRIVSCHPDFDAMSMPSALLISDGSIFRGGDGNLTWADFKDRLN